MEGCDYLNKNVFITGGTGYIGSSLIPELERFNFTVTSLVRKGSESKLSGSGRIVTGSALDESSYSGFVRGCDTFIHLVGAKIPLTGMKDKFKSVDLVSVQEAVKSALKSDVKHFIYLSVAHPAPVMKDYINVRMKGEELLVHSGMNVSLIRPWYVLGPGHKWPYVLLPFYKLFEKIPFTKDAVKRLGLVKLNQLLSCIVYAVNNPPGGVRIYNTEDIKNFGKQ